MLIISFKFKGGHTYRGVLLAELHGITSRAMRNKIVASFDFLFDSFSISHQVVEYIGIHR